MLPLTKRDVKNVEAVLLYEERKKKKQRTKSKEAVRRGNQTIY